MRVGCVKQYLVASVIVFLYWYVISFLMNGCSWFWLWMQMMKSFLRWWRLKIVSYCFLFLEIFRDIVEQKGKSLSFDLHLIEANNWIMISTNNKTVFFSYVRNCEAVDSAFVFVLFSVSVWSIRYLGSSTKSVLSIISINLRKYQKTVLTWHCFCWNLDYHLLIFYQSRLLFFQKEFSVDCWTFGSSKISKRLQPSTIILTDDMTSNR